MCPLLDDQLNELTKQPAANIRSQRAFDIQVLHYLRRLNEWRWLIALFIAIGILHGLISGFSQSRRYESTLTLLVLPHSLPTGQPTSLLFQAMGAQNPDVDLVTAILMSKRMAEDVVDKFDLQRRYRIKNKAYAINRVGRIVSANSYKNLLYIKAITEDPKLSSDIANFYAENLDTMNRELALTSERQFVKVLDPAVPATEHMSRGIARRMFLGGLFGCLFAILVIFAIDYTSRLRSIANIADMAD